MNTYAGRTEAKHREARGQVSRAWYNTGNGFWRHLVRKYGLTQEDFSALLGKQLACCKTCGVHLRPRSTQCHVDHDHAKQKGDPGFVRGLLCQKCNRVLGFVQDDVVVLRRLADYIEAHTRETKPAKDSGYAIYAR